MGFTFPACLSSNMGRKYFGRGLDGFQKLLSLCTLDAPNLDAASSYGFAWDGEEAWTATVFLAFSSEHYWVGVRGAHARSGWHSFPAPVRRADVPAMLKALCPSVAQFRWTDEGGGLPVKHFPWPVVEAACSKRRTFFAVEENVKGPPRVFVGSSSRIAPRVAKMKLKLLGICGRLRDVMRAALTDSRLQERETGWFLGYEGTLDRIAKWTSLHARTRLKQGTVPAAPRTLTTYNAQRYAQNKERISDYRKKRKQKQ